MQYLGKSLLKGRGRCIVEASSPNEQRLQGRGFESRYRLFYKFLKKLVVAKVTKDTYHQEPISYNFSFWRRVTE